MNLYIHVPFCRGKCAYCAFYSEPAFDSILWKNYLTKLDRDFSAFPLRQPIDTLYIGGGTPTLPDTAELKSFFALFQSYFEFAPDAEISMECNPETVDTEKAELIAGFANRISMGAQSFSPELLANIGRTSRNPEHIRHAFDLFRSAGIKNLGLDLMYALPGQTTDMLKRDLLSALELEPSHISAYSLTLEEGTALASNHGLPVPSDDVSADMWEIVGEVLAPTHPRYEISNYAPVRTECRHNQNVWHGASYFGFGPGACSFDGQVRWTEVPDIRLWLAGEPPEKDAIPREERLAEILMMGLRTVRGWTRDEFISATGESWNFPEKIARLKSLGLLEETENILRPTHAGLSYWNEIAEELL